MQGFFVMRWKDSRATAGMPQPLVGARALLGLKTQNVGLYGVFYRTSTQTLSLLRVLHGARDLPVILTTP
ncbi:MAG: hypothetical protein Tsb002_08590 [Wenzhouxiangellaceae bacterium]